jgi:hypothetical protein
MGVNLHASILAFFEKVMSSHGKVVDVQLVRDRDDYIYRITRAGPGDVMVHLSDAYRYGIADFAELPDELRSGGFVLVARPEGAFDENLVETARAMHIGIGKLAKFMGALNRRDFWNYVPKER